MNYLRRLSLCAVLVAMLGAIGASAASAAPPEFVGPMPLGFESKLTASTLETVGGLKVTCTAGVNSGQVTGSKTLTVEMRFTGCMLNGIPCRSSSAANEIETSVLTGTLGYINKAKKQVGLDLASPGAPLMDFTCGEDLQIVVTGSVIGKIKPVDKLIQPPRHFTLKFVQSKGKQKPTKLEAGLVDVLETSVLGGPLEATGLSSTDTLSFAGPLEIKA